MDAAIANYISPEVSWAKMSQADREAGRTHPVCAAVTPVSEGVSHCP